MAGPDSEDGDRDWLKRPFARTFDLISSEYGWTDEQIWDTTLARMRQIRDVIMTRRGEEWDKQVTLEEAKVRVLAGAAYGAAGDGKGMKAAAGIELFERPDGEQKKRRVPQTSQVIAAFGGGDPTNMFSPEQIEAEARRLRETGELELHDG